MNIRAVETFGLAYPELKELVRNSIEYSFLPGASLWGEKRAGYGSVAEACGSDALGAETPSQACASFIAGSEKAKQQWELEARFTAFEATAQRQRVASPAS